MKKLLTAVILCAVLLCATAAARYSDMIFVGNYAYDATGAVDYDYSYENMAYADYGSWVMWIEYCTYENLGMSVADFEEECGTSDPNSIAWIAFDNYYGYGYYSSVNASEYEYLNCVAEGSDSVYGPEIVYFNGVLPDEYGGGVMTGAVIVKDGSISFLECESYDGQSLAEMQRIRTQALDRFIFSDEDIADNPTKPERAHKGGIWETDRENGNAMPYSIGGPYSIVPEGADGSGYLYTIPFMYYDGRYAFCTYAAYEDYGISRKGMMSQYPEGELDDQLAKAFFAKNFSPAEVARLTLMEPVELDGATCIPFRNVESTSAPCSGATILDADGILHISCHTYNNSVGAAGMDAFLDEILGLVRKNGAPLMGD